MPQCCLCHKQSILGITLGILFYLQCSLPHAPFFRCEDWPVHARMTRTGTRGSQNRLTVTCLNNGSEHLRTERGVLGSVFLFSFSTQEYPVISLDHGRRAEVVNHTFLLCTGDIDVCSLAIIFL